MKTFLISPPFGNFISHPQCTRIRGTFTLNRRSGALWAALKSIRPTDGGWVNKMGLRNPGIWRAPLFYPDDIYSLAAIDSLDWGQFLCIVPDQFNVELNLSCPNKQTVKPNARQWVQILDHFKTVSVKVAPFDYVTVREAVENGVTTLHLSNTRPHTQGGESGAVVKASNRYFIPEVKVKYPHIQIIGGGGIYTPQDVRDYQYWGAKYFSLSTIWFNPLYARRILKCFQSLSQPAMLS